MKIQVVTNGLANQIQALVFARYLERQCPNEKILFDDSEFFIRQIHNGYELEKVFGLKLDLLSECFTSGVWHKILQLRQAGWILPQILLDMGISVVLVKESRIDIPVFSGEVINIKGFQPEITKLPYMNQYYFVVPLNKEWFSAYEKENLDELTFPELTDKKNLKYAEKICKEMSVGIHIRRGDFVSLGWTVPNECFKEACESVLENWKDAHFFIFSNDLAWCQKHAIDLGFGLTDQITYVSGNICEKAYVDMQLLSMCKGIVRPARSTFSQVAGWLNRNLKFEIILGEPHAM